ncbi:MAG: hypothetical protein U0869_01295 [Chloroflexota bacterium]
MMFDGLPAGASAEELTRVAAGGAPAVRSVVVVVSAGRIYRWVSDVIAAIDATRVARVVAVVSVPDDRASAPARLADPLLFAYAWADRTVFGRQGDPTRLVEPKRLAELLGGTPESVPHPDLVIRLDGGEGSLAPWDGVGQETWALIHGADLDPVDRPDRLAMAPGGPEMLLGRNLTISRLVAHREPHAVVLGQAVSRVDPVSMTRGARGHLRKLPGLVARALERREWAQQPAGPSSAPEDGPPRERSQLDTQTIAAGLARVPTGYVRRLVARTVNPEVWAVAVFERDSRSPLQPPTGARFLVPPAGVYWADPFPVREPDRDLLFIEEFVHATRRGRLAVVELDDSPRGWRSVSTILELSTHLSYPFVFEWAGRWYLLPEQAETGALELYVAERFPTSWRWHCTVLDVPASDATIAQIDGHWWMFAAIAVAGSAAADELHLFHASAPVGPWQPHPLNPVVSDVRTGRPAGRLVTIDGTWYRIAQDGERSYGHSIVIIRIDELGPEAYRETIVDRIGPDWAPGLKATHTMNEDGGLVAVDAIRSSRRAGLPVSRRVRRGVRSR